LGNTRKRREFSGLPISASKRRQTISEMARLAALPPIHELPGTYADVATSPLRVTVKRGSNTGAAMQFELQDRPE